MVNNDSFKKEIELEYYLKQHDMEQQHHAISFYDVKQHPKYQHWILGKEMDKTLLSTSAKIKEYIISVDLEPPHDLLDEILFEMGLDINEPIEKLVCTHRAFNNSIQNTARWSGLIRKDEQWEKFVKEAVK